MKHNESWRGQFGGCECWQGREVCNCILSTQPNSRPSARTWAIVDTVSVVALFGCIAAMLLTWGAS